MIFQYDSPLTPKSVFCCWLEALRPEHDSAAGDHSALHRRTTDITALEKA